MNTVGYLREQLAFAPDDARLVFETNDDEHGDYDIKCYGPAEVRVKLSHGSAASEAEEKIVKLKGYIKVVLAKLNAVNEEPLDSMSLKLYLESLCTLEAIQ